MALNSEQLQYINEVRAFLRGRHVELLPQRCFLNAMALTIGDHHKGRGRIQYWEGHFTPVQGSQDLLGTTRVPHAWVTVDGTLYDPTAEVNRQAHNVAKEEYRADAYDGKPEPLQKVMEAWAEPVISAIDPELRKELRDLIDRQREKALKSKPADSASQAKQDGKAQ